MEVDQRSIYVGNVSGRSWSRAHLAAACPAGRMSAIPSMGACLPPTEGWLVPSEMLLLCPARTGNVAQHLPVILSRLQTICCKCQLPKITLWVMWCCLFPQSKGAVSWIWVSRLEHSAGGVS